MAKLFQSNLKKNKLKFSVTVTLKKDVLDPQGKVVENTLISMGMGNLKSIRQGKFFEIEVDENDQRKAEEKDCRIVFTKKANMKSNNECYGGNIVFKIFHRIILQ